MNNAAATPPRPLSPVPGSLPAGSRWGEGAQSVLEQLMLDRTGKPDATREGHPSAAGLPRTS